MLGDSAPHSPVERIRTRRVQSSGTRVANSITMSASRKNLRRRVARAVRRFALATLCAWMGVCVVAAEAQAAKQLAKQCESWRGGQSPDDALVDVASRCRIAVGCAGGGAHAAHA